MLKEENEGVENGEGVETIVHGLIKYICIVKMLAPGLWKLGIS